MQIFQTTELFSVEILSESDVVNQPTKKMTFQAAKEYITSKISIELLLGQNPRTEHISLHFFTSQRLVTPPESSLNCNVLILLENTLIANTLHGFATYYK